MSTYLPADDLAAIGGAAVRAIEDAEDVVAVVADAEEL